MDLSHLETEQTFRRGELYETADGIPTDELIERLKRGGVVWLRGFPFGADSFAVLTSRLGANFIVHQNTMREPRNPDGTTQTVTRGNDTLPLHRERAYIPFPPDLLFFCCIEPAACGGATTVCDGVEVLERLPKNTRDFCQSNRLVFPQRADAEIWKRSLGDISAKEAKERLDMMASMLPADEACEYRFGADDVLETRYVCPIVHRTKLAGLPAFASYLFLGTNARDEALTAHYFSGEGDRGSIKLVGEEGVVGLGVRARSTPCDGVSRTKQEGKRSVRSPLTSFERRCYGRGVPLAPPT